MEKHLRGATRWMWHLFLVAGRVTSVGFVGTGAKKTPKVEVQFVSNDGAPKATTIVSPGAGVMVAGRDVAVWVVSGSSDVAVEWGPEGLAVGTARAVP